MFLGNIIYAARGTGFTFLCIILVKYLAVLTRRNTIDGPKYESGGKEEYILVVRPTYPSPIFTFFEATSSSVFSRAWFIDLWRWRTCVRSYFCYRILSKEENLNICFLEEILHSKNNIANNKRPGLRLSKNDNKYLWTIGNPKKRIILRRIIHIIM